MKRRAFLQTTAMAAGAMALPSWLQGDEKAGTVQVGGKDPHQITRKAIEALGGMKRFVSRGDVVMIKPNIGWNRRPEQAACTNPEVVRALIELCQDAGAARIMVMDNTCHRAQDCYQTSGIKAVAEKAGVELKFSDENRLVIHDFKGERIGKWPVFREFLEVDRLINVPVLKHHGLAELTIGMKNLFGVVGGNRGKLHRDIGKTIVDLNGGITSHLTVVDAWRILLRNGPVGGNLEDVQEKKTVIASTNVMNADVLATLLFGKQPLEIPYLREGELRGMGFMDPTKFPHSIIEA